MKGGAELAEPSHEPRLRFEFVEMLFALALGEIAIQVANLWYGTADIHQRWPSFAHLALATIVVSTSWVGWRNSPAFKSDGPKELREVKTVFSISFLVLMIDVLLVIFYFMLVRSVDDPARVGKRTAENESWLMTLILFSYLVWDIATKGLVASRGGANQRFYQWMLPSAICTVMAGGVGIVVGFWRPSAETLPIISADVALLAVVFLFRVLKYKEWKGKQRLGWIGGCAFAWVTGLLGAVI
jgi:hypothetical protein